MRAPHGHVLVMIGAVEWVPLVPGAREHALEGENHPFPDLAGVSDLCWRYIGSKDA